MKTPATLAPEIRALAERMPDELSIGERMLLTPWERSWLTHARPVSVFVVHQLLAALIAERRRHFRQ